jgi:hypothetical protein
MSAIDQLIALLQGTPATYADYLKRTIITTVLDTTDEKLLNYIYTLLMNEVNLEKQPAES